MKKVWSITFSIITILQLGGFCVLERYLTPTSTTVALASSQIEKKIQPPEELLYDIDPKGDMIAIYDHHQQVIVKNRNNEVVALTNLPGVHHLQWMDNGTTLYYVRKIYGKNEVGVFKIRENQVVPLHDIASTNVSVENVYNSPYAQIIYTIYRQDNVLFVASYEAIFGWKARPLTGIVPKESWLDEKEGALYIKDQQSKIWKFTNGKFDEV